MEVKDIFVQIGTIIVFLLEFFFRNSITLIVHAHKNYPDITNVIFFILGVYIIYKILVRTLRSWFNFMIFTIKLIFVLFFVFLVFVIYLRGWETFIYQDVPFLKKSFGHLKAFNDSTTKNGGFGFSNILNFATQFNLNDIKSIFTNVEKNIKENLDESSEYFEYINSQFGNGNGNEPDYDNIQKLVEEGIGYLQENVDLNALRNNIQDILNRHQN